MQYETFQYEVSPSSGVPIYRQLMEQVTALIISNKLNEGEFLPSVRKMATDLEVNMMTVSKAYSKLEAKGWVKRIRGKGMQVLKPIVSGSVNERKEQLLPHIESVITRGLQLGLTEEQIITLLTKTLKQRTELM